MCGELTLKKVICKKRFGFTLTEVVVAASLLLIAIVPILKALTAVHLNSTLIERRTKSLVLAQAKLDDIKARSIYSYSSSYNQSNTVLETSYLCNVADSGSGSDIRTMTVSVGYDTDGDNGLDAEEIKVTLTTYIANRWTS
jgi:Tfp pilus assembly protein PilV